MQTHSIVMKVWNHPLRFSVRKRIYRELRSVNEWFRFILFIYFLNSINVKDKKKKKKNKTSYIMLRVEVPNVATSGSLPENSSLAEYTCKELNVSHFTEMHLRFCKQLTFYSIVNTHTCFSILQYLYI